MSSGSKHPMMAPTPQSGAYNAEYTEKGHTAKSMYRLKFVSNPLTPHTGTVTGEGWDPDGPFNIDGGVYDLSTGRVAWGERSRDSSLYSEVKMECVGSAKMTGSYSSNMGMGGDLKLVRKFGG